MSYETTQTTSFEKENFFEVQKKQKGEKGEGIACVSIQIAAGLCPMRKKKTK